MANLDPNQNSLLFSELYQKNWESSAKICWSFWIESPSSQWRVLGSMEFFFLQRKLWSLQRPNPNDAAEGGQFGAKKIRTPPESSWAKARRAVICCHQRFAPIKLFRVRLCYRNLAELSSSGCIHMYVHVQNFVGTAISVSHSVSNLAYQDSSYSR